MSAKVFSLDLKNQYANTNKTQDIMIAVTKSTNEGLPPKTVERKLEIIGTIGSRV